MNAPLEGPSPPPSSDSLHRLALYTVRREPLLDAAAAPIVERCLQNLTRRYPGLKLAGYRLEPQGVQMTLDLQRLDEDLARIVQSFKNETKILLKKSGLDRENFWQWGYEEL